MSEQTAVSWWMMVELWINPGDWRPVELQAFANIAAQCLQLRAPPRYSAREAPARPPQDTPIESFSLSPAARRVLDALQADNGARRPAGVSEWVVVGSSGVAHACPAHDLPLDPPRAPSKRRRRGRLYRNGMLVEASFRPYSRR